MEGLKKFIAVDNHKAVKVGDLHRKNEVQERTGHHLQRVNGEVRSVGLSALSCLGGMEGTSSDTEDGKSFSDEDGEHNVENFMLSSFAHQACSPLLQGFLHELCWVALTCHFSLDVLFHCQER